MIEKMIEIMSEGDKEHYFEVICEDVCDWARHLTEIAEEFINSDKKLEQKGIEKEIRYFESQYEYLTINLEVFVELDEEDYLDDTREALEKMDQAKTILSQMLIDIKKERDNMKKHVNKEASPYCAESINTFNEELKESKSPFVKKLNNNDYFLYLRSELENSHDITMKLLTDEKDSRWKAVSLFSQARKSRDIIFCMTSVIDEYEDALGYGSFQENVFRAHTIFLGHLLVTIANLFNIGPSDYVKIFDVIFILEPIPQNTIYDLLKTHKLI